MSLTHTPNECELKAANTRSCDRTFSAETLGCRQGESKRERVYTLPRFPGVYNNWFRSFQLCAREEENTVWAVCEEDSENIGRAANAQEAIVRRRTQSATVMDAGESTKTLEVKDMNHSECL